MEFSELLASHDDPIHWEHPPGFDYEVANSRFRIFMKDLSSLVGEQIPYETGSYIQDASFHSQAYLPLPVEGHALIRFSNFGEMVAIDNEDLVPDATLKSVQNLIASRGYIFVPASVLDEPYTGRNPGVTGISHWWVRYFDWV